MAAVEYNLSKYLPSTLGTFLCIHMQLHIPDFASVEASGNHRSTADHQYHRRFDSMLNKAKFGCIRSLSRLLLAIMLVHP